jgi:L-asparaginase II
VALAEAWLARLGLGEEDLACGPHPPLHGPSAAALIRAGRAPHRTHNNCSGKHAGMLAAARHLGAPTRGYELPAHAVQRHCTGAIAALAGLESLPEPGIDGCCLPNHPLPLRGLARAAANLADPAGQEPVRRAALSRIGAAMRAHPHQVAGTGRCCTAVMAELPGVIAKTGAEGAYLAALPGRSLGIALKAEDGATRAAETALLAVLAHLDALVDPLPEALARFRTPRLRNTAGTVVGRIRPAEGWPSA